MRAIGLMSGTSMDGIDVALIETDGETVSRFGPSALHFYQDHEVALLRRAMEAAPALRARARAAGRDRRGRGDVDRAARKRGEYVPAVNGIDRSTIDVVGFHGQTILHRPKEKLTVQIGDGARLAAETKLPVVYDFRAADVAAGGQGAPLVPVYHRALARTLERPHPIAVLNLGGVANITFIDGDNDPIACDTGPGECADRRFHARPHRRAARPGRSRRPRKGASTRRRSRGCSRIRSSRSRARNRSTATIFAHGSRSTPDLRRRAPKMAPPR